MIIERQKQRQFLQDELKKQTDEFRNKLESSAQDLLLNKHEMFVAIFIKYMEKWRDSAEISCFQTIAKKE